MARGEDRNRTQVPPDHILRELQQDIRDALDHARGGRAFTGIRLLVRGLDHADEARLRGAAWGGDLVKRYRWALERYTERYGLKIE